MSEPRSTPLEASSARATAMRRLPLILGALVVLVVIAGISGTAPPGASTPTTRS